MPPGIAEYPAENGWPYREITELRGGTQISGRGSGAAAARQQAAPQPETAHKNYLLGLFPSRPGGGLIADRVLPDPDTSCFCS